MLFGLCLKRISDTILFVFGKGIYYGRTYCEILPKGEQ